MTTITRQKMSSTVETGFHCANCGVETVTYDGFAPVACVNCNAPNPVQIWQTTVKDITTTEVTTPMPIAPIRPS